MLVRTKHITFFQFHCLIFSRHETFKHGKSNVCMKFPLANDQMWWMNKSIHLDQHQWLKFYRWSSCSHHMVHCVMFSPMWLRCWIFVVLSKDRLSSRFHWLTCVSKSNRMIHENDGFLDWMWSNRNVVSAKFTFFYFLCFFCLFQSFEFDSDFKVPRSRFINFCIFRIF